MPWTLAGTGSPAQSSSVGITSMLLVRCIPDFAGGNLPGVADDERNIGDLIVGGSFEDQVMVPQHLAVIAGKQDDRVIQHALLPQVRPATAPPDYR